MGKLIFVTGGARSGKSSLAEKLARELGEETLYIATAQVYDDEMRERVEKHRAQRPAQWRTHEGFRSLGAVVQSACGVVLLDCLTLMITAILMEQPVDWDKPSRVERERAEGAVMREVEDLLRGVRASVAACIVVSNEVGMGLVPEYPLGRVFRDIAGRVNQRVAGDADEVWFAVSGLPLRIK